jgi:hypothetical protein
MASKKPTAVDYIERHDEEMRLRLGEMAEYAARISVWWNTARVRAHQRPDEALAKLVEAEVSLDEYVQFAATDCMRKIRAAVNRLETELPEGRARTKPVTIAPWSDALRGDRRN